MAHTPVLLQSVLDLINPQVGEVVVDGTVGSGGHALALGEAIGLKGRLICLDQDQESLAKARANLASLKCQVDFKLTNFRTLKTVLAELEVKKVAAILLDLGVHSDQLGPSGRGFSFLHDEPLLMTMKADLTPHDLIARDIVNTWEEDNLAAILDGFGEERFAGPIAKAIIIARREYPIESTNQLVQIINKAVPVWYTHKRLHFATRTFQALRLAVNDELPALTEVLPAAWESLAPGGRLAIISFHSLEARLVKNFFRGLKQEGYELLTKHAVKPERAEQLANPRSRSAELRVIKKSLVKKVKKQAKNENLNNW
ncbi:MAG: 16S rRNA (cytosine(1402)-N(4))-methyltransferase RsmH [bacterium]|nr:16S rRNA (cytosine(1402)-N(4))-methyltransferase RsmH [bacterium]